ncbi:hypothetical protein HBA_0112 [Sodalis endosymbiont of Henestaris halophilus]|nr:hypothetical protein HBA_0112 [Sodalis endosymbiont of Henestaris halophilus]
MVTEIKNHFADQNQCCVLLIFANREVSCSVKNYPTATMVRSTNMFQHAVARYV